MRPPPDADRDGTLRRDRLVTVAVALACVLAIAVSATAMGSTLQTEPDDAIDLDFALLPVGAGEAVEVKNEIESGSASGGRAKTSGSGPERRQSAAPVGEDGSGEAGRTSNSDATGRSDGGRGGDESPVSLDPLDRLLALLERLLPVLLALLVVGVLLARYRAQLLAVARARLRGESPAGDGSPATVRDPSPGDEVERAWHSLVRRTGVDRPWARTPGECAAAAVDRGYDRESVARLRRLFEEVRYGGRRVTDRRVRRARDHLESLDIEERP